MKAVFLILFNIALFQCLVAQNTSFTTWESAYRPADSLVFLLENSAYQQLDFSTRQQWVDSLYLWSNQQPDLPVLKTRAMYWDAGLRLTQLELDSALCLIKKAGKELDTLMYSYDYERLLFLEASLKLRKGDWLHFYSRMKRSENYFNKIGDGVMLATAYINIGNYLKDIGEYQRAYDYLSKASDLYVQCDLPNYKIKNSLNLSNVLYQLGKKEDALSTLQNLLNEPEAIRDTVFYVNVLFSLSNQSESEYDKELYASTAYNLTGRTNNDYLKAKAAVAKAQILKENNRDSAFIYFSEAKNYIQKSNNHDFVLPVLEGIIDIYAEKRNWKNAFSNQQVYQHIKDSIDKIKNLAEVTLIENKSVIDKYEYQLKQVEKEAATHRRIVIGIISFILVIAILICYMFWLLRNREKAEKRLKQIENKEFAFRLENEKLKNERFQLEIDSKNRELTSNTLLITENNILLKDLQSRIDSFEKEGRISSGMAVELNNQIKDHLAKENGWHYFKIHFEQVHPDFFIRLKEKYPCLSENDLRLCAYVRIGMENKQIAQLLSVQPNTIKTTRHRIRKKLDLSQDDSLEDFLRLI